MRGRIRCALVASLLLVGCTRGSEGGGFFSPRPPTTPAPTSDVSAGAERPNILVILTDDQRAGTLQVMPKTRDVFVAGGTSFTNGFVTTPVCCPSRSSILTGRYVHNTGVRGNGDALRLDQTTTVARYLRDAGYRTGIVGKFLNSWPLDRNPPNFDRWSVFNSGYVDTSWNIQGHARTISEYSTDFISERAVSFIQHSEANDAQPWFLYVAPSAPHDPWTPEPDHASDPVPPFVRSPAMLEAGVSDKPPWVRDAPAVPQATIAQNRADQLRTLKSVDDMVGRVFRSLRALGEDRRTLAVYLSDNGFLWGEHQLAGDKGKETETGLTLVTGKRFPYTQSARVPFLLRWPGHVAAGRTDSSLVGNVDLSPTFVDAAGITPSGPPMDGRSLLGTTVRDHLLLEYFRDPLYPPIPSWASYRTADLQYIEYFDAAGRRIFREYYDLEKDPFQLRNLFGDANPSNDPDVAALHAQIAHDRRCLGTTGAEPCP